MLNHHMQNLYSNWNNQAKSSKTLNAVSNKVVKNTLVIFELKMASLDLRKVKHIPQKIQYSVYGYFRESLSSLYHDDSSFVISNNYTYLHIIF